MFTETNSEKSDSTRTQNNRSNRVSKLGEVLNLKMDEIRCSTLDSEKKILFVSGSDYKISQFDLNLNILIRIFEGHSLGVNKLCLSNENEKLLSVGCDEFIKIWSTLNGQLCQSIRLKNANILDVKIIDTRDCFVTSDSLGYLTFWSMISAKKIKTISAHQDFLWTFTILKEKGLILTSGFDKYIRCFDWDKSRQIFEIPCKTACFVIESSANQEFFFAEFENNAICQFEISTNNKIGFFSGHSGRIRSILLAKNDQILISGSEDCSIKVWSTISFSILRTFKIQESFAIFLFQTSNKNSIGAITFKGSLRCFKLEDEIRNAEKSIVKKFGLPELEIEKIHCEEESSFHSASDFSNQVVRHFNESRLKFHQSFFFIFRKSENNFQFKNIDKPVFAESSSRHVSSNFQASSFNIFIQKKSFDSDLKIFQTLQIESEFFQIGTKVTSEYYYKGTFYNSRIFGYGTLITKECVQIGFFDELSCVININSFEMRFSEEKTKEFMLRWIQVQPMFRLLQEKMNKKSNRPVCTPMNIWPFNQSLIYKSLEMIKKLKSKIKNNK